MHSVYLLHFKCNKGPSHHVVFVQPINKLGKGKLWMQTYPIYLVMEEPRTTHKDFKWSCGEWRLCAVFSVTVFLTLKPLLRCEEMKQSLH